MAKQQKRSKRGKQKRSSGTVGNVSPTAEPVPCDYCHAPYWRCRSDQRYCTPSRERKLAHLRRGALVDVLYTLIPWRVMVTVEVIRRMVEAAERALLEAVRRLGWAWNMNSRRFEWKAVQP